MATASEADPSAVNVFPNPSSGDFVFEIGGNGDRGVYIRMVDQLGREVASGETDKARYVLHGSSLAPGIYTAIVQMEEPVYVRLVKVK